MVSALYECRVVAYIPTYFYFDYKDSQNQTAEIVIASLLKQLAHPLDPAHPCLEAIYDKIKNGSPMPILSIMVELFITCSESLPAVSVILDAFDECGQQDRIIGDIVKRFYLAEIKVYITTRPHLCELFASEFDKVPIIPITADDDDVKNYIAEQLQKPKRKLLTDDFKKEIVQKIGSRAQGM
jgi:hypothetical protein